MKFYLALTIAKLSNFFINLLKLGSGYTWPGHLALSIYPDILSHPKLKFPQGTILISGTNGKTTTSKLLTHLLESVNYKVVHNKTGANLMNGVVSAILLNMNIFGKHSADYGVFEVDENNLPLLLKHIDPDVLVLLNLSRDQLDRYGEVDIILEKWMNAVEQLSPDTELVLDETQTMFGQFKNIFKGDITYFNDSSDYRKHTNLVGNFNSKNVNAAVYTSLLLGLTEDEVNAGLPSFEYAYGRGELIEKGNVLFKILLAKNPASFNYNLDAVITEEIEGDVLFFILNDNIPDGRDVSWIYDIDSFLLKKVCEDRKIVISGTRYLDMAVRLKYVGAKIDEELLFSEVDIALNKIQQIAKPCIVFPNYSAMLNLRKHLTGKDIL